MDANGKAMALCLLKTISAVASSAQWAELQMSSSPPAELDVHCRLPFEESLELGVYLFLSFSVLLSGAGGLKF